MKGADEQQQDNFYKRLGRVGSKSKMRVRIGKNRRALLVKCGKIWYTDCCEKNAACGRLRAGKEAIGLLDWDSLYGEADVRAMTGGKKRFYDNRVFDLHADKEDGKFTVRARVSGDRDYAARIQFDEQGGLYDYACDCAHDTLAEGPCRHIVATALAYENKFPGETPRGNADTAMRRSDASVRALIERYGKERRVRRAAEESEKVRLAPAMQIGQDGRLRLKFTLGVKKMYTVKDVSDFAECWRTGAEKRYGVELTVAHVPEAFDPLSARLAAFVCGSCRERAQFLTDARAATDDYRDELRLSAGGVDEFMRLYAGQTVATCDAAVRQGVRLICEQQNAVKTGFSLTRASGGYVLESRLGAFTEVCGKDLRYIVTDGSVYPVTDAYYCAVMPALVATRTLGRLYIAESDMSQFYNSVLTRVLAFAEIDAPDVNLSVFEAAPLELKMYVNAVAGGIAAQVHASYDGETDIDITDDGAAGAFVRDYESESAFLHMLETYFPQYPDLTVLDEGDVYRLLREGLREIMGLAEVYVSDDVRKMKVKKPPRFKVGVRLKSDLLGIDLSAEEYTADQLREILAAYKNKRSYVRLTDGSFVDLLDPSVAAIADLTEAAQWKGDELTLPVYYAPYVDGELKNGFFHLERSDAFKQLVKELESAGESLEQVPASLAPVLRNYQKTGFRWLKTLSHIGFGGILADDMGLGKSLQVIALLLSERKEGATSIIVCPTTLVLNWVNELKKFAPGLRVTAITGNGDERKELLDTFPQSDVVITSYELLRRDAPLYADT
ncbi:MAG: SNF2 helicase associated domain-containing protein, partial [Clostridiales bacterium]|nr:SNF2 helicase associated domain-containing protein [Clostridiales bacterium]